MRANFLLNGKKLTLQLFIRKEVNCVLKIPDSFPYSQFAVKCRPGYPCVNQLLAITHEIHKSFNNSFEVRGFLSAISTALGVWHDGLLLKLNQN